jgi:uncharacterized protein (DUF488 family)
MTKPIFTIGHSTRTISEFVALLQEAGVDLVVDVRSIPRSRTNPQFNRDSLPEALAAWQIGYQHIAELGGRRGKAPGLPQSPNGYWRVRGFRNYADYALTPAFADGLAQLLALAKQRSCAIMCSEAVWWRCHRRIITDYLLVAGVPVLHILAPGHIEPASLTPGAVTSEDGVVLYPGEAADQAQ